MGRGGGGLHTREIGTMWQIGVLTGKPCTFLAQKWETREATQNGPNLHGFQVRTPICHIVPVSRAYLQAGGVGCS